jgi:hypothetical protein
MMNFSRRKTLALALLAATCPAIPAFAQAQPLVVYDNELKSGWQNRSWAKVETPASSGEVKPLKVQGDAWSALALYHDAFATAPYSKLTFYINGGAEGGQRLTVKAMADGKALDSSYVIEPKARTWTIVEIALPELSAANRSIDGLMLQADAAPYKPYYITKIQLE